MALTCVLSMYNARPQTSFSRLSLFYDCVEEAVEHLHSIALTNTGQTGMVGQRLTQIVSDVPQHGSADLLHAA